jgi:hypothetical protein
MYLLVSGRIYLGYTSVCEVDLFQDGPRGEVPAWWRVPFLRNHAGAFQRTWLSGTYAVLWAGARG